MSNAGYTESWQSLASLWILAQEERAGPAGGCACGVVGINLSLLLFCSYVWAGSPAHVRDSVYLHSTQHPRTDFRGHM